MKFVIGFVKLAGTKSNVMKKILSLSFPTFLLVFFYFTQSGQAQFLKRLREKVKQTAEGHVTNDAGNATNKAIDKTENSVKNGAQSSSSNNSSNSSSNAASVSNSSAGQGNSSAQLSIKTYKNYDFVPGDTIIFQSQLSDEKVGELPSQFTILNGQIDVEQEDGENVMHFGLGPREKFTPRMSTTDYVPDQFTIEFDFKNEKYGINHLIVAFDNSNYYGGGNSHIIPMIHFSGKSLSWTQGDIAYPNDLHVDYQNPLQWHHVAIAINKNTGKIYIDQYRIASVNNISDKANSILFLIDGYENSFLKNVRIAAGGIDIYKKVTTDGRIVMHGILFDVDKANLKPESMGSINQIYDLLKKNADLKFEIDGHTDNTGDAAHNLTLSQQRADAVKTQLVNMGIDGSRLTTKGFGDTKSISDNNTPEGKANNRRVEFVKD